jgi:DNA invertase Pin-like site-specific DNA recombinase
MEKIKIVGYTRVSTVRQFEKGLSLEGQKKQIEDYATNTGAEVLEIIAEQGSGGNNERKGLLRAVELCKKEKALFVVTKVDRLGRSVGLIDKLIKQQGFEIEVLQCIGMGTLGIQMLAMFAEFELTNIRERNAKAIQTRKDRNIAKGLPENYGFNNGSFDGKDNPNGIKGRKRALEVIQEKTRERNKELIEKIKILYRIHGNDPKTITKELNYNLGYRTRAGWKITTPDVRNLMTKYISAEPYVNSNSLKYIPVGQTVKEYATLNLSKHIRELMGDGFSFSFIAKYLNTHKVPTPTGKGVFYAQTVKRLERKTA